MDLREARELLQVDEAIDARGLERAYLRAVKRHKPERDPEGFQRVRDAYERLRAWAPPLEPIERLGPLLARGQSPASRFEPASVEALAAPVTKPTAPPEGLATEAARDESLGAFEAELESRSELERAEARVDRAPPPPPEELAPSLGDTRDLHRERRWQQIESATPERRVELLYDALAEDAEDGEAREELVHALLDAKRGREAADVARDAQPSLRSFLIDEIAFRSPTDLPDDMLDELRGAGSLAIVPALIERDAIDEAARCVEEAIDGLSSSYVGEILEPILALAAADEGERALSLLQRLTTALDRLGLATRVSQHDALTLLLLGELLAVWNELPLRAWEIVLSGMRAFDGFEHAREEAKRWASVDGTEAQLAMEVLARRAPNLSAVLGDAFQPPRRPAAPSAPRSSRIQGSWWLVIVAVMMVSGLVRGATRCSSLRSRSLPEPLTPTMAQDRLSYTCEVAPAQCGAIRELSAALTARDCPRARLAEPEVRAAIASLDDGAGIARLELREMIAELESICLQGPHSPSPP